MTKTDHATEYAACTVCGLVRRINLNRSGSVCRACARTLRSQLRAETWMKDAACGQHDAYDPRWWTGDEAFQGYALYVCRRVCTVREQCLTWAMNNGETDNIYGGKTPVQRGVMAREHRARVSV